MFHKLISGLPESYFQKFFSNVPVSQVLSSESQICDIQSSPMSLLRPLHHLVSLRSPQQIGHTYWEYRSRFPTDYKFYPGRGPVGPNYILWADFNFLKLFCNPYNILLPPYIITF